MNKKILNKQKMKKSNRSKKSRLETGKGILAYEYYLK